MVNGEEHPPSCLASTRNSEHTIADEESRTWSNWKLSPILFQEINHLLGPVSTDQFASRLSSQLLVFLSWKPDPLTVATDAFTQDWSTFPEKQYAILPWGLIGRVLSLVHSQGVQELVLVGKPKLGIPCSFKCWSEYQFLFLGYQTQYSQCVRATHQALGLGRILKFTFERFLIKCSNI